MKPVIRVTTLCLVIVITALARTASEELQVERQIAGSIPTVDQILEKYIQAVGGKEAVTKLKARLLKGSLVTASGSAPLEIYQKLPNMFLVTIDSLSLMK